MGSESGCATAGIYSQLKLRLRGVRRKVPPSSYLQGSWIQLYKDLDLNYASRHAPAYVAQRGTCVPYADRKYVGLGGPHDTYLRLVARLQPTRLNLHLCGAVFFLVRQAIDVLRADIYNHRIWMTASLGRHVELPNHVSNELDMSKERAASLIHTTERNTT